MKANIEEATAAADAMVKMALTDRMTEPDCKWQSNSVG
jgi:hypothetical protein